MGELSLPETFRTKRRWFENVSAAVQMYVPESSISASVISSRLRPGDAADEETVKRVRRASTSSSPL